MAGAGSGARLAHMLIPAAVWTRLDSLDLLGKRMRVGGGQCFLPDGLHIGCQSARAALMSRASPHGWGAGLMQRSTRVRNVIVLISALGSAAQLSTAGTARRADRATRRPAVR
eukprot:CAMPEP_0174703594 /NCGR_PEP_ID=MMETSP1094-20130205/7490_1 /TAXON_ID=156173 /ORGANISM="Chrysochromulina brevifilum, Strain UTEX LB 985" /LENGTH=112 /DNA_ID=CAMNT_0015901539 /DNA_START=171 /DNA_END=510 /DNA_ORIENTATION=+